MLKKHFSKILKYLAALSFSLLGWAKLVLAGYGLEETQGAAKLPTGNIQEYLGKFAGAGLALSGSIFLFLVVYGGIILMTAAGSQDKVKKGKEIITWAIIGALVLGGAYAITTMVFGAFGK